MAISSIGSLSSSLSRGVAAVQQGANPFSQALTSASSSQQPASAGTAAATAQQQYNQSLASLQTTLAGLFSTAGVDTSQPIALEQGPEGNLSVSNSHPDLDKIEQVLANHPELATQFKTVAANFRAAQQAGGVQNLPNPTSSSFILTLTGNQAAASLV